MSTNSGVAAGRKFYATMHKKSNRTDEIPAETSGINAGRALYRAEQGKTGSQRNSSAGMTAGRALYEANHLRPKNQN